MEVGAIGFHDKTKVKSLWVVKDKDIVKALEKTKEVSQSPHDKFRSGHI
jgi:1,2-phenylacetyl-CoA epoxidase PaaB subunit